MLTAWLSDFIQGDDTILRWLSLATGIPGLFRLGRLLFVESPRGRRLSFQACSQALSLRLLLLFDTRPIVVIRESANGEAVRTPANFFFISVNGWP